MNNKNYSPEKDTEKKKLKEILNDAWKKSIQHSNLYDLSNQHLNEKSKKLSKTIKALMSPTWLYAKAAKKGVSDIDRTKGIIARNYGYLAISIAISFAFLFVGEFDTLYFETIPKLLVYIPIYILIWSRCNEILFAFITDALDKSTDEKSSSLLTYRQRIELALLSYIELILNYAIIILILPRDWLNKEILSIADTIYYSGVTITTLGYGDIHPVHWITKLLSIHEVLAGFTLIVVSFAVYSGRSSE